MSDLTDFVPAFSKELSPNDIGATASHQAGLLIPWKIAKLPFFPRLDEETLNPREIMRFKSFNDGSISDCNFIFYNVSVFENLFKILYSNKVKSFRIL